MDWKPYYFGELTSRAGRDAADAALARWADGDDTVADVLRRGGIASFPHVTLLDSAEPIARVAQSVLALAAPRVVALGVLHGGTLPEPYREDLAEMHRGSVRAAEIFRRLGGVFVERGSARTPWGDVAEGPAPAWGEQVRADPELLANEFSLDLFLAVLAAASRRRGVPAPQVTRVFVSATRSPDGSFATATGVAAAIRPLLVDGAVCVATGDLVHYGNSYTPHAEMTGMPEDETALVAWLRPKIDAMHEAALARGEQAVAFEAGSAIRSDQRNVLPVVAELLGPGAAAEVLSLRLSDYARINGVAPPCFVASALVAFRPRA